MIRMRSIGAIALTTAAALGAIALASPADSPSPFAGTWVLIVGKSTFDPGPPLKSHTFRIAQIRGGGIHGTIDNVKGDGSATHLDFTAAFDGKYVPLTGSTEANSVSLAQVNPTTFQYVFKKAKKRIEWGTFTVSEDGKTMQGALSGNKADGTVWNYHYVFDRRQ
jgi:hypothetical protein